MQALAGEGLRGFAGALGFPARVSFSPAFFGGFAGARGFLFPPKPRAAPPGGFAGAWIPAFAGMTEWEAGMTEEAGKTGQNRERRGGNPAR